MNDIEAGFVKFPMKVDLSQYPLLVRYIPKGWRDLSSALEINDAETYGVLTGAKSGITVISVYPNCYVHHVVSSVHTYQVSEFNANRINYYFQYEPSISNETTQYHEVSIWNDRICVIRDPRYPVLNDVPIAKLPERCLRKILSWLETNRTDDRSLSINQKYYELFNILPRMWFNSSSHSYRLYDCLRNIGTIEADECEDTINKLVADRTDYIKGLSFSKESGIEDARLLISEGLPSVNRNEKVSSIKKLLSKECSDAYEDWYQKWEKKGPKKTQSKSGQAKAIKAIDRLDQDINDSPLDYDEYVYILTSKRYFEINLFKIGRTINLNGRLSQYNCGNVLDDDKHFYVCSIKTANGHALEQRLHKVLSNFHHEKEWFQINRVQLLRFVQLIYKQESELLSLMNCIIAEQGAPMPELDLTTFTSMCSFDG